MNGLQEEYADKLDFFHLNIEDPASLPLRERFNIVQRSQYILIDAQGKEVNRWFGLLKQIDVEYAISQLLGT